MARFRVAKFDGGYVHNPYSSLLTLAICFIVSESVAFARPPLREEYGSGSGNAHQDLAAHSIFASSWLPIVSSLGFLIVLVSFLALCGAGGCCGKIHWFGRSRQEAPLSFSNPMTEPGSTMMVPISQIDVRALELDPIVFEPLPTVQDLAPITNKVQLGEKLGHSGHRSRSLSIPIVPFNADDSAVYAHDWFEEPLNNFPRSSIEYVKEIGKGWFGQVLEAEARDIVPFARKIRVVVKLLREDANGIEQMRFLDESRMYRDSNHGNILKLMGYSIEKLPFLLIMEHCPQGDLKSFLISNVIRAEMLNSQGTIVKMVLDVAKGLDWLHNAGFVHPDLAARNCQVGSENRVIIGDYGLGTQTFKDDYHWSSGVAVPLRWTAPETLHCTSNLIQILKVTESSNIWTLGVVMWEICEFGKLPYFELADDEVIGRVIIDKNYFLGRPTMPCMSEKEELYRIMSSCWEAEIENRPRLYTIVQELEDLHGTFLTSNAASPSKDEFESKWEQLAGRTNSDDDKRRKKNVSFRDLEKHVRSLEHTSLSHEMGRNAADYTAEDARFNDSSDLSRDITMGELSKDLDLDEEQWTKKIERGDITQKVLEKSQSVQDLMVLTHFEQSDDLDSLLYVTSKEPYQSSDQNGKHLTIDSIANSSSNNNNSNSGSNSTLRKACSEPAIDCISLANSSHTLTPPSFSDHSSQNSTLVPQDLSPRPPEASTPNHVGVNVNVISATPSPNVKINVVEPTPTPTKSANNVEDAKNCEDESRNTINSNPVQRKLLFNFDSCQSPTSQGVFRQRQTSTPMRSGSTPSPRISDFEDGDGDQEEEEVFDNSGYYMESTFGLSPISQNYVSSKHLNRTLNNGNLSKSESLNTSSVVTLGASDDHELGSYQGVKSQLHEISQLKSSEEDFDEVLQNTLKSELKPVPRRILFNHEDEDETGEVNGKEVDFSSDYPSSFSSNGTVKDETVTEVKGSKNDEPGEENDFWKQQFMGLQMELNSTRELFKTGLSEKDLNASSNDDNRKFVEDIEADVEELGSLVLHDLEEPDSLQTVIKETREAIKPEEGVNAKLAFESNNANKRSDFESDTVDATTAALDFDAHESQLWDVNNSIEIRKGKGEEKSHSIDLSEVYSEDVVEAISTEFVPSKWNQSLVPSRSAIKSPEQQPAKSSQMKKSVSFEMKKTQLVYEYPPPPVVSDSEEEEKSMTPITSKPLPSTSSSASSSVPLASSLDWELTQEELENVEMNHENWDDDIVPQPGDPMDVYRISGFNEDSFQVRPSSEPFVFSPVTAPTSTLGELRHTRDRLRLDLSRGEANFLDDDSNKSSNPAKLDSGVGSSTNVSPFNNCDILTKRSNSGD